jgi:hypothetical protein
MEYAPHYVKIGCPALMYYFEYLVPHTICIDYVFTMNSIRMTKIKL